MALIWLSLRAQLGIDGLPGLNIGFSGTQT
jgi:hypothetical protein